MNTGVSVSLSTFSSAIQGNLMTVKAGAVAISLSAQPTARNVIAGQKGVEFARYVLDASQSGEGCSVVKFYVSTSLITITASQISNCNLHDGINNITDGTNVTWPPEIAIHFQQWRTDGAQRHSENTVNEM